MKLSVIAFSLSLVLTAKAEAVERYTEAKIAQVESSDNNILLFLEWVSGDALPQGNGGSNEPLIKPFLFLADSATDIANRKHFFATALVAQTNGSIVRFRWEDAAPNAYRINVMLVR